jgi:hypothetical protein
LRSEKRSKDPKSGNKNKSSDWEKSKEKGAEGQIHRRNKAEKRRGWGTDTEMGKEDHIHCAVPRTMAERVGEMGMRNFGGQCAGVQQVTGHAAPKSNGAKKADSLNSSMPTKATFHKDECNCAGTIDRGRSAFCAASADARCARRQIHISAESLPTRRVDTNDRKSVSATRVEGTVIKKEVVSGAAMTPLPLAKESAELRNPYAAYSVHPAENARRALLNKILQRESDIAVAQIHQAVNFQRGNYPARANFEAPAKSRGRFRSGSGEARRDQSKSSEVRQAGQRDSNHDMSHAYELCSTTLPQREAGKGELEEKARAVFVRDAMGTKVRALLRRELVSRSFDRAQCAKKGAAWALDRAQRAAEFAIRVVWNRTVSLEPQNSLISAFARHHRGGPRMAYALGLPGHIGARSRRREAPARAIAERRQLPHRLGRLHACHVLWGKLLRHLQGQFSLRPRRRVCVSLGDAWLTRAGVPPWEKSDHNRAHGSGQPLPEKHFEDRRRVGPAEVCPRRVSVPWRALIGQPRAAESPLFPDAWFPGPSAPCALRFPLQSTHRRAGGIPCADSPLHLAARVQTTPETLVTTRPGIRTADGQSPWRSLPGLFDPSQRPDESNDEGTVTRRVSNTIVP